MCAGNKVWGDCGVRVAFKDAGSDEVPEGEGGEEQRLRVTRGKAEEHHVAKQRVAGRQRRSEHDMPRSEA